MPLKINCKGRAKDLKFSVFTSLNDNKKQRKFEEFLRTFRTDPR